MAPSSRAQRTTATHGNKFLIAAIVLGLAIGASRIVWSASLTVLFCLGIMTLLCSLAALYFHLDTRPGFGRKQKIQFIGTILAVMLVLTVPFVSPFLVNIWTAIGLPRI